MTVNNKSVFPTLYHGAEKIPLNKTSKTMVRSQEDSASIALAMEAAKVAWWKMDLSTGNISYAERETELLGYPSGKLNHCNEFMSLIHPDDRVQVIKAMKNHLDGRTDRYDVEFRILTKSHGYKWFLNSGSVETKDKNGKPLIFTGFIIDITDRKLADELLKSSELRYRRLFESAKDGILILDAETGMIMDANPYLIELLGYTGDQFLEKAIWEIGFFKDIIANKQKFEELQQQEYVRYEDLPLETTRGKKINVEFVSNVYLENHKKVIQCNIRDITLRKKAELAYHQSEEKFRLIMENSADAVFIIDHNGKYLFFNQAVTDMLGYSPEEIKQKSLADFMLKNKRSNFNALFEEVLNKGKIYAEIEMIRKNRNRILTDFYMILLPNGLIYCMFKNITMRRETELLLKQKSRQFKQQNKEYQQLNSQLIQSNLKLISAVGKAEENDSLKTAFLQNMSHEIRTPMNGILGFSDLLKNPHLSGEDQQKYIRIIEQSGRRMLNIINDIVDISKIETGQIDLFIQDTNVNDLLRHLHTFFEPEAELKGLELNCELSLTNEFSRIETDNIKLIQILSNLLKNALKFTETGSISFGYNLRKNMLEFYVKDTGIGIKPEMQEIIFDRFRQVDISIARNYEGAGLGLAISKAFILKLGGKIWMKSEFSKGANFYFNIPYRISKSNHVSKKPERLPGGRLQNINILITEDDSTSMLLLKKVLEFEKANLFFASNGQEAFKIARTTPELQIILMDLKMPVMDGYTATQMIKRIKPEITIIAQSACAFSNDQDEAIKSGCDDYIRKPINIEMLLEIIHKNIGKPVTPIGSMISDD